jgi:hypothetical protein
MTLSLLSPITQQFNQRQVVKKPTAAREDWLDLKKSTGAIEIITLMTMFEGDQCHN